MKIIPTKIHGIIDYMTGILLIAAPWVFGFADDTAATYVPVILGAGIILYSLLTNYEMGAYRKLSMPSHLMMDLLGGIFLAASPWIFGFDDRVYLPHLIVGIMEILVSLLTERHPRTAAQYSGNGTHKHHSTV